MTICNELKLQRMLADSGVAVVEPGSRMIQLNGVLAGQQFSKPRTNVLLRWRGGWEIFVDDDFYYIGNDPSRRRLFCGRHCSRWTRLLLPESIQGDVDHAILMGLKLVDSPILERLPYLHSNRPQDPPSDLPPSDDELRLAQFGQLLAYNQLLDSLIEPGTQHAETIQRVVAAICRRLPPTCPLLLGPAGCGKSVLARMAAAELLQRRIVRQVLFVRAATISCGAVLPAQRDVRLRALLQEVAQIPGTLVLLEQFQLAVSDSSVAFSLLADALDDGLKLVAIASPGVRLAALRVPQLARRLQPIRVPTLNPAETRHLLDTRVNHLADELDVAPEAISVLLNLSGKSKEANPGAALGLLDAVLANAACTSSMCIGPDDVYHIAEQLKR